MNFRSLTFHSISLLLVMAPCSYTSFRRAETDACAVRRSLVAPSVMKGEIIIRPDYQRKSTAKYVLSPGNDRNRGLVCQKDRLPFDLCYLFFLLYINTHLTKTVFKPKEPVCLVRALSLMPSYIYSIVCPLWLMKCYMNSDTSNSLTFQAQGVRCLQSPL